MKKNLAAKLALTLFIMFPACNDHSIDNSSSAVSVPVTELTHLHIYSSIYSTTFCFDTGGGLVECSNGSDRIQGSSQFNWGGVNIPGPLASLINFGESAAVDLGGGHICALESDHTVQCWGYNRSGQLGDGTEVSRYSDPVTVSLASNAFSIATGWAYTCASLDNGHVQCWGFNGNGQLGDGFSGAEQSSAVTVVDNSESPLSGINAVVAATDTTCGMTSDGHAYCWGINSNGEVGSNSLNDSFDKAAEVLDSDLNPLSTVTSLCAGRNNFCALHSNGAVSCWGDGSAGQIGNGQTSSQITAVTVIDQSSSLSSVTQISCGAQHVCALLGDGSIKCWGSNEDYELGNQSSSNASTAVAVTGLGDVAIEVAAGQYRTCALLQDTNTVQCWGNEVSPDGSVASSPTTLPSTVSSSSAAALAIAPLGPSFTNECFPIGVYAIDSTGVLASLSSITSPVHVDLASTSGQGAFYADSGCSSSASAATIQAESNSAIVYYFSGNSLDVNNISATDENTSTGLDPSATVSLDVLYAGC